MKYRSMRMIVMFDLPMDTKKLRREYAIFRKHLIKSGFIMLQYSVYSRICPNKDFFNKYENQIMSKIPNEGHIRIFSITERQLLNMKILTGARSKEECLLRENRMVII